MSKAIDPNERPELEKYKMLVFCKFYECAWNVPIEDGVHIPHHKDWKPFSDGDADKYKGICGRGALGLSRVEYKQDSTKKVIAKCDHRSDTHISGHQDFARLLQSDGSPFGGTLGDSAGNGFA